MKVTYINHSGFLLEWEHCCWLFDYYQGELPALNPEKHIFVFSSHSHSDHFNPRVFNLSREYPRVTYIFSNEIRRAVKKLQKNSERTGMTEPKTPGTTVPIPEITFLQSGTDTEFEDGGGGSFGVHTLFSTDCGCAFVLTYKGKIIYHAGDLHWWTWPGESEAENRDMAGRYKKQTEYLARQPVDLAFTPLDPRQEQDYGLGLSYLLKTVYIRKVFPMHFWNDFSIQQKYLSEYPLPEHTEFYKISRDGQSWELEL